MKAQKVILRPKKVVLFPENGQAKFFLSLTRPHSQMYIRIYVFNFKKKKKKKEKEKEKQQQKQDKKKEKKLKKKREYLWKI